MKENKLIAEFMEYPTSSEYWKDGRWEGEDYKDYYYVDGKYDECWGSSNFHVDDMAFGLSWDWLMPVVEKINNTERYEVCIGDCHCHITDIENDNHKVRALTLSLQGETTMGAVYLAIVEFIKNQNN